MYNEILYHLDLCILSYHLHAQTLIWPNDPYMEQVATSTTQRRENFMAHAHTHFNGQNGFRGPGSTQGWPSNVLLDPIMSRYNQMYPWRPVFVSSERRDWLWHQTPTVITDKIQNVYVSKYLPGHVDPLTLPLPAPLAPPSLVAQRPNTIANPGTDRLYGFEGGTGTITGSAPSWSLMGFCLARDNPGGGSYDVHIAFRGSRSGAAGRAAMGGIQSGSRSFTLRQRDENGVRAWKVPGTGRHVPRGNGDWVTDMDMNETVADTGVSVHGAASRGFSSAMKTCAPLVVNNLAAIQAWKGAAPRYIWLTGHSLGGALAGEMTSALVCGDTYGPYGAALPGALANWPWDKVRLVTMSAPVVGGDRFHATLNSKVYARRVYLGSDPITQSTRHHHVGSDVHLTPLDSTPGGVAWLAHHEPFNVRRSLLQHLADWEEDTVTVPIPHDHRVEHANEPWKKHASLVALLTAHPAVAADIPVMMANFPTDLVHYIDLVQLTFKDKTSHNAGHGSLKPWKNRVSHHEKTDYDNKCNAAKNLLNGVVAGTPAQWNAALEGIGGPSFNKFLRMSMILAAYILGVQDNGGAMNLVNVLNRFDLGDI